MSSLGLSSSLLEEAILGPEADPGPGETQEIT